MRIIYSPFYNGNYYLNMEGNNVAMDVQVFHYAMKEYMGSTHKNLNHLMTYAKELRIEYAVRTYTEVML